MTTPAHGPAHAARDFYVGYRPLPMRHRRDLRIALPALLLVWVAIGAAVAAAHRSAGPAVWAGEPIDIEGVFVPHPYPMLIADADGAVCLLVEAGKVGALPQRLPSAATRASARGYTLTRPSSPGPADPPIRMLELVPDTDALRITNRVDASPPAAPALTRTGTTITIRGEILDSKCFLGAMKPGDGRAHRSCAQLCIQGGIPPMIAGRDLHALRRRLLLLDAGGNPANHLVIHHTGLPVVVTGELASLANAEALLITSIAPPR